MILGLGFFFIIVDNLLSSMIQEHIQGLLGLFEKMENSKAYMLLLSKSGLNFS